MSKCLIRATVASHSTGEKVVVGGGVRKSYALVLGILAHISKEHATATIESLRCVMHCQMASVITPNQGKIDNHAFQLVQVNVVSSVFLVSIS